MNRVTKGGVLVSVAAGVLFVCIAGCSSERAASASLTNEPGGAIGAGDSLGLAMYSNHREATLAARAGAATLASVGENAER